MIAIVALNLAVFRSILDGMDDPDIDEGSIIVFNMTLAFGPTCLLCQVGWALAFLSRPGHRPFWAAVAFSSPVVVGIFGWACLRGLPLLTDLSLHYWGACNRALNVIPGVSRPVAPFLEWSISGHLTIGRVLLSVCLFAPQLLLIVGAAVGAAVAFRRFEVSRRPGTGGSAPA